MICQSSLVSPYQRGITSKCTEVDIQKPLCEGEPSDLYHVLCFVQWYETLNRNLLPIDKIDRAPSCIRLKWDQNPGEPHVLKAGKELALVPKESISSALRFVTSDTFLDIIEDRNCQNIHARKPVSSGPL